MLRMIDSIWKQGWTGPQTNKDYILDMNLTPYDVLSTPKYNPNKLDEDAFREFGFIQKINGRTLSDIQANHQVMFRLLSVIQVIYHVVEFTILSKSKTVFSITYRIPLLKSEHRTVQRTFKKTSSIKDITFSHECVRTYIEKLYAQNGFDVKHPFVTKSMDKNLLHVWYMNSLAGYSVATYIIGIDPKVFKMMPVVYTRDMSSLKGLSLK